MSSDNASVPPEIAAKVEALFVKLLRENDFWMTQLVGMKRRADYSIPTLQVEWDVKGKYHTALVYNPNFLASQYDAWGSDEEGSALFRLYIAHEVSHVVLRHIVRWARWAAQNDLSSAYSNQLGNIAADLAANSLCLRVVLPAGLAPYQEDSYLATFRAKYLSEAVFPDAPIFDFPWNLSMEQYMQLLLAKFPPAEPLKIAFVTPQGVGLGDAENMSPEELAENFDIILTSSDDSEESGEESEQSGAGEGANAGSADGSEQEGGASSDKAGSSQRGSRQSGTGGPSHPEKDSPSQKPKTPYRASTHSWVAEPPAATASGQEKSNDQESQQRSLDSANPSEDSTKTGAEAATARKTNPSTKAQSNTTHYDELEAEERRALEQDVKTFMSRSGAGSVPGFLLQDLPKVTANDVPSLVSWKPFLKACLRRHAVGEEEEACFSKANRRLVHLAAKGVFPYPSFMPDSHPKVVFIRDTSGSMDVEEMREVLTYTISLLKTSGQFDCWLVDADTEVKRTLRIRNIADLPQNALGRGGTSFEGPLCEVEDTLRPDLIIYGTDGEGYVSPTPHKTPVVWLLVTSSQGKAPAPWGAVLYKRAILRRK